MARLGDNSRGSCVRRLQRELAQIHAQGISTTIHLAAHNEDMTSIEALIIGPPDTPYDAAMLHFSLKVPPEYPLQPPEVRFIPTNGGTLRIHPQLYADGKVCLSILGTWPGPKWTASHSIGTVLLSIQSLLTEEPLRCEPGWENARKEAVDRANIFVVHEATRVLILGQLEGTPSWGSHEDFTVLTTAMHRHLHERRGSILSRVSELAASHDSAMLRDPFTLTTPSASSRYDFSRLHGRLSELIPTDHVPIGVVTPMSIPQATASAEATTQSQEEGSGLSEAEGESAQEQPYCRICHLSAAESGLPLICPCHCSGSMAHAHSQCLLDWLQHSGQATFGLWHCDICRAKFRVGLGPGKVAGTPYLRRSLDVFEDSTFDASGHVAVLLFMFLQVLFTSVGRSIAYSLHSAASLLCWPLPSFIGKRLLLVLAAPAGLVELATFALYVSLFVIKAMIARVGARWHPNDWGSFGQDYVAFLLAAVADNLGFTLGINLDGLLILAAIFTSSHLTELMLGQSLACTLLWATCGRERAESMAYVGLKEVFPVLNNTLPQFVGLFVKWLHLPIAVMSLALNIMAMSSLLKRTFIDRRPVAVEVLPAHESLGSPSKKRKKLLEGSAAEGPRRRATAADDLTS